MKWPFMRKSDHEAVQRENYTLRDALRSANYEILRLRATIVRLGGHPAQADKPPYEAL
mgnify:CR=1 FL=1